MLKYPLNLMFELSYKTKILIFFLLIGLVSYHLIFAGFFPNANGFLGHDYGYFLPSLLAGYYWFSNNGLFAVPWFTPAFCAGLPFYANPQSMVYSAPQALTYFFDPLQSVYISFLLFAGIGFTGMYKLSTDVFKLTPLISAYAAMAFLFNGFFTYRMIIGHLTYHAFALIPLIAWLLLRPAMIASFSWRGQVMATFSAGIAIAYFIYSGAANYIVAAMIAVVGIFLLAWLNHVPIYAALTRLFAAAIVAFCLALSKLTASIYLLFNFPRDLYALPGIDGIQETLFVFFSSFFLNQQFKPFSKKIVNTEFGLLGQHEFEFGVTLIPLIVTVFYCLCRLPIKKQNNSYSWKKKYIAAALALIMLLPLFVNTYYPWWNDILKNTPYIKSSSSLLRWFSIDIPLIILISAICLNSIKDKISNMVLIAMIAAIIMLNALDNKEYYQRQNYNPVAVVNNYNQVKINQNYKKIDSIVISVDKTGTLRNPIWRNNAFIQGYSIMNCYEALFGYNLETFPIGNLKVGSIYAKQDGFFNIKNPVCYLYKKSNACEPGAHFHQSEIGKMQSFINYKPFDFNKPLPQIIADYISFCSLIFILSLAFLIFLSAKIKT